MWIGRVSQKEKAFMKQAQHSRRIERGRCLHFHRLSPNSGFLKNSGIQLDPWGFIVTGLSLKSAGGRPNAFTERDPFLLETSILGIFAAGDVRDASTKQVVSAAGEGSTAALEIREFLKRS